MPFFIIQRPLEVPFFIKLPCFFLFLGQTLMVWRICEIMVTLDFIFQLMLYSNEDVSFNTIYSECVGMHQQFNLSMWLVKNQLETPFKGDNIKALIKLHIVKNGPLFLWEIQKIAAFAMVFFGFQWPKNRLKMFLASPNDQKYPCYQLVLKFSVALAGPLRLAIPYFF